MRRSRPKKRKLPHPRATRVKLRRVGAGRWSCTSKLRASGSSMRIRARISSHCGDWWIWNASIRVTANCSSDCRAGRDPSELRLEQLVTHFYIGACTQDLSLFIDEYLQVAAFAFNFGPILDLVPVTQFLHL